jgi:hypothetical protein
MKTTLLKEPIDDKCSICLNEFCLKAYVATL